MTDINTITEETKAEADVTAAEIDTMTQEEDMNNTENKIDTIITEEPKPEVAALLDEINATSPDAEIQTLMDCLGIRASYRMNLKAGNNDATYCLHIKSLKKKFEKSYTPKEYSRVKKICLDFEGKGHPLDYEKLESLIEKLRDKMDDYVDGYFHDKLGWERVDGKMALLVNRMAKKDKQGESYYSGKMEDALQVSMETVADEEEFKDTLRELLDGKPKLQVVYAAGYTGIISQLIRMHDTNIMISLYGKSGIGKTSSEQLVMSAWGNPEILTSTYNATEIAINKRCMERMILPNIIDEGLGKKNSSAKDVMNYLRNMVFDFSSGQTRETASRDSVKHFCPVILSTENSLIEILSRSTSNGEFERLLELRIERGDLTSDEDPDAITDFTAENYGVGAYEFGQYLTDHELGCKEVRELYKAKRTELETRFPDFRRVSKRVALIIVTAELLNEALGLDMDTDAMVQVMMDSYKVAFGTKNDKVETYSHLVEIVKQHADDFAKTFDTYRAEDSEESDCIGVIRTNRFGNAEVYVEYEKMVGILSGVDAEGLVSGDYSGAEYEKSKTEVSTVLDHWATKGWLIAPHGRYTDSRKVNGKSVNFCRVRIDKELLSSREEKVAA